MVHFSSAFYTVAALPTCYFPPRLSLRGGSVGPETSSEFLPIESGILCRVTRRTIVIDVGCEGKWPRDFGEPPDEAFLQAVDYSLELVPQAP